MVLASLDPSLYVTIYRYNQKKVVQQKNRQHTYNLLSIQIV